MLEPDFGSFVVVTVVALGLLFLAGLPWRWFLMMVGAGLLSMIGLIAMAPYRVARVTAFLNPCGRPVGQRLSAHPFADGDCARRMVWRGGWARAWKSAFTCLKRTPILFWR